MVRKTSPHSEFVFALNDYYKIYCIQTAGLHNYLFLTTAHMNGIVHKLTLFSIHNMLSPHAITTSIMEIMPNFVLNSGTGYEGMLCTPYLPTCAWLRN